MRRNECRRRRLMDHGLWLIRVNTTTEKVFEATTNISPFCCGVCKRARTHIFSLLIEWTIMRNRNMNSPYYLIGSGFNERDTRSRNEAQLEDRYCCTVTNRHQHHLCACYVRLCTLKCGCRNRKLICKNWRCDVIASRSRPLFSHFKIILLR